MSFSLSTFRFRTNKARRDVRQTAAFGQKNRNGWIVAGLGFSIMLASPLAISAVNPATFNELALVQKAKSFAKTLAERSPGVRGKHALLKKAKVKTKLAARKKPSQRALTKMQPPKEIPAEYANMFSDPLVTVEEPPISFAMNSLPPSPFINPPTGGFPPGIYVPPGGVLVPPGGGGTPPPEPPPPPPPTPAVPEPSTWAMMLFGFAMVGRAVQRRRIKMNTAIQGI